MASIPLIYLLDTSGQAWLLGVNNGALITTTKASSPISFTGILLNDTISGQTWKLSVLPSGLLQTTLVVAACAQNQVLCLSPSGTLYGIQVANGLLQTAFATACNFALSDMDSALADRLYDSTGQFWTQTERILYIQEAFRTWNALTGYWRGDFTFQSQPGKTFYDLTDTSVAPNTLRPLTLTQASIAVVMEYHLLEPPVGLGTWVGSLQFNVADIAAAIARRRDELIGATGCTITQRVLPAVPGRTYLSVTTLDLRRVTFLYKGTATTLWEDDTWATQAFDPDYTITDPTTPEVWMRSTEPLLSFDVDSPPLPGQYELLTIESGQAANTNASACGLSVPDDWAWVIKWGALADLLSRESNAKDLPRAKYCEARYKQGMALLTQAPALLAARASNVPLQIDAVTSADQYNVGWEGQTPGPPQELLSAGMNLVALAPPPDAGPYSITATVVENAPIPVNLSDCLSLTQDIFDVIIDYAQHLAAFKQGGAEFQETMPLLQRFMQMAALYASRLVEEGQFAKTLYGMAHLEDGMNPRYSDEAEVAS